tara:strand:- start:21595 stop:22074 length:480 start_codon:yes stop_codon:yes gene_type:complete
MAPLADSLSSTASTITTCRTCGNVDTSDPCGICNNPERDLSIICVVEEIADLWAIERTGVYKGLYHVLGGTLSALDGMGPEDLNIGKLVIRAGNQEVSEIVLATNATVSGQTTAHYIQEKLLSINIKVSRLAHGVPVGGELDYLDDGTLTAAMNSRRLI